MGWSSGVDGVEDGDGWERSGIDWVNRFGGGGEGDCG